MKNQQKMNIKTVAGMAAVLALGIGNVQGQVQLGTTNCYIRPIANEKAMEMMVHSITPEFIQVGLLDLNGRPLWADSSNDGNMAKRINLANLPEGTYMMAITEGSRESIYPFTLSEEGVEYNREKTLHVSKPLVKEMDGKILLGLNLNRAEPVKIDLIDEAGNSLYKEKVKGESEIHRMFNVRSLESGLYTLRVETAYRTFTHPFTLNSAL